jgi:hypothetical protein
LAPPHGAQYVNRIVYLAIDGSLGQFHRISTLKPPFREWRTYPRIMKQGAMDAGAWSCGMVAGLLHDVPTVKELISDYVGGDRYHRQTPERHVERLITAFSFGIA